MSIKKKLLKNSSVYSIANVLQQMMAFFLLPLYTHYLNETEFGVIQVVNSIAAFLVILLNLSLYAAVSRFYFDYKDDEQKLRKFWGTIFTFLFIFIGLNTTLLLIFGKIFLQPVLSNVSFYPYMMIGLVTVAFEPFYRSLTGILIATERSKLYGFIFLVRFLITTTAIIVLITGFKAGPEGVLLAHAGSSVIFFVVGIFVLRKKVAWFFFRFTYLKEALKYSLPLVPHHLSATVKGTTDKLFLNNMISTASAGLYGIAFRLSSLITIIYSSVNMAFYPIFMSAMKDDDKDKLNEIKQLGMFLVFGYFFMATMMSFYSREIFVILTTPNYYPSYKIVPILAFSGAVLGVYVLIVNTLFYYKKKIAFISVVTITSAILNIILNYFMILKYEIIGAAYATLITNIFTVIAIAIYQKGFTKIKWEFHKYTILFLITSTISIAVNQDYVLSLFEPLIVLSGLKLVALLLIFVTMNKVCWGNWFYLFIHGKRYVKKMMSKNNK